MKPAAIIIATSAVKHSNMLTFFVQKKHRCSLQWQRCISIKIIVSTDVHSFVKTVETDDVDDEGVNIFKTEKRKVLMPKNIYFTISIILEDILQKSRAVFTP